MLRQYTQLPISFISSSLLLLSLSLLSFPSYSAPPAAITFPIQQISLEGDSPISDAELYPLLASFEGKDYGLAELQDVSKQIENYYRDAGFSFYRVVLPTQSLAEGTVAFKLVSFTVGEVAVDGNQHFDEENLLASLPELNADNSPNTKKLAKQMKVANYHASKEVSVTFKQSDEVDKISAQLNVLEQNPSRYSLVVNNTGTDESGNVRVTGAYQYSNLWNKDHSINLSYTTSPNHTNEVQQYGLSYSAPLYQAGGWLSAYYAKTDISTGEIALGGGSGLAVSGSGEMYGLHYLHFLDNRGAYEHQVDVGIDNRLFENKAVISDGITSTGDIAPDVRSTPFSISYRGNINLASLYLGHSVTWAKNLSIGSLNDDTAYSESRFNAQDDWDKLNYNVFANLSHKGWLYRATLKGQYSSEPLISGEQFGLGGVYSVRGYEEREVSSDIGNMLSIEAYTPAWHNAKLLAFYDYGQGRSHDALPDTQNNWHLASVGVGLRWQWKTNIQASVDFAHTLRKGTSTSDNHNHAHASIVLQY